MEGSVMEKIPIHSKREKLRLREDTKLTGAETRNQTSRQPALVVITPCRMVSRSFWEVNLIVEIAPSRPFKLGSIWWTIFVQSFQIYRVLLHTLCNLFISTWTFEHLICPSQFVGTKKYRGAIEKLLSSWSIYSTDRNVIHRLVITKGHMPNIKSIIFIHSA